jgi:uncharacterized protein (TIGR03083 family)
MTEPVTYARWMELAAEEYRRLDGQLRSLDDAAWQAATECPGWDVRQVVAHVVGETAGLARMREQVRQVRKGRKLAAGRDLVDGMNDLQVSERAEATPADLLAELQRVAPAAMRSRRRLPRPVRAIRVPFGPPIGTAPLGYLMGTIYTRDAWMHRLDIHRATGTEIVLTADHDGDIVRDAVADWAGRHSHPYRLLLTGPAGGEFTRGSADATADVLEMDAVEFARSLSGREAPPVPYLPTIPF